MSMRMFQIRIYIIKDKVIRIFLNGKYKNKTWTLTYKGWDTLYKVCEE